MESPSGPTYRSQRFSFSPAFRRGSSPAVFLGCKVKRVRGEFPTEGAGSPRDERSSRVAARAGAGKAPGAAPPAGSPRRGTRGCRAAGKTAGGGAAPGRPRSPAGRAADAPLTAPLRGAEAGGAASRLAGPRAAALGHVARRRRRAHEAERRGGEPPGPGSASLCSGTRSRPRPGGRLLAAHLPDTELSRHTAPAGASGRPPHGSAGSARVPLFPVLSGRRKANRPSWRIPGKAGCVSGTSWFCKSRNKAVFVPFLLQSFETADAPGAACLLLVPVHHPPFPERLHAELSIPLIHSFDFLMFAEGL